MTTTALQNSLDIKNKAIKALLSLLFVSVAVILQKVFWSFTDPAPFLFFYPAIILASIYGDGLIAIVLSMLAAQYFFIHPLNSFDMTWPKDYFRLLIFFLSSFLARKIVDNERIEKLKAQTVVELLKKQELDLQIEKEARERFVTTLSHDLQSPLTAAKLSSQMLLRNNPDDDKIRSFTEKQNRSLGRIEKMINDLLDANRIHAGKALPIEIAECNLNNIIEATTMDLTQIHGPRFKIEVTEPINGYWSESGIQRILENLCTNALKYGTTDCHVLVSAHKGEGGVTLKVNNKGSIIPLHEQAGLFEPHARTHSAIESKKKGWGLGLTLVKGLTEAHGGSVKVESTEAEGTTFSVTLPLDCRLTRN